MCLDHAASAARTVALGAIVLVAFWHQSCPRPVHRDRTPGRLAQAQASAPLIRHRFSESVSPEGGIMAAAPNRLTGELISECLATFIILGLGDSAAAMYTLYDPSPYQQAYWGVCIAW